MSYSKTTWIDRAVEFARRFTDQNSNVLTLTPSPGTVTEAGTDFSATNMNNIEQGIFDVDASLTAHEADYVRQPGYGTTAGSANTYTLDLTPNLASYTAGVAVAIKINVTNTGASTLNIDGLGVVPLKKANGDAFEAGDLVADAIYPFRYDGTNFRLQFEGGGNVKSIQSGQVLISALTTSIALSSVDLTKAIPIVSIIPYENTGVTPSDQLVTAEITTATNLNLQLVTLHATYRPTVNWSVIEFNNVKSLQSGTISNTNKTNNITITSVDIGKSMIFVTKSSNFSSASTQEAIFGHRLTSGTNLELVRGYPSGAVTNTYKWYVVEFN